jgi:hypothetical protein
LRAVGPLEYFSMPTKYKSRPRNQRSPKLPIVVPVSNGEHLNGKGLDGKGQIHLPSETNLTIQIRSELGRILEMLVLESPTSFTLGGHRFQANGSPMMPGPSMGGSKDPLSNALQMQLYLHCYARRFTGAIEPMLFADGGKDLTAELAQASASRERWEAGWEVMRILPSGQVAVQRNGFNRVLWPGEYVAPDNMGGMPPRGSFVSVYCRRQSTTVQPGFYFAFGETLTDQQDESNPVRFYWNIGADAITQLVREITGVLNRHQIPFRFKCQVRAGFYKRTDAAVLYMAKRYYRITAELLEDIWQKLEPQLQPDTPLFCKRLGRGLGLAEDPGNGESFGSHRCRLLAEAICHAQALGKRSVEERLEEIEKHFKQSRLTLASPYLNPGSMDNYHWPVGQLALS